ncbi:hypothetical protein ACWEPL_40670 [Nonomuraea sp. NPDC004186]
MSTDFLYRHPQFRDQITALRQKARGRSTPPADAPDVAEDTTSSAVRALAGQLREAKAKHRTEVAELQKALAAAHGENLSLRRRLQA